MRKGYPVCGQKEIYVCVRYIKNMCILHIYIYESDYMHLSLIRA